MTSPTQPVWLPRVNTCAATPAGRWWDAIVVPQPLGLAAFALMTPPGAEPPGPVVWEPSRVRPRLYFLVPLGTAEHWDTPGGTALGRTTFVVLPGPTSTEPPGVHWLSAPRPGRPDLLVDPATLDAALRAAAAADVAAAAPLPAALPTAFPAAPASAHRGDADPVRP